MAQYNIGIDTGGTYTDAVLVDMASKQVLTSAKALTTRGDLSLGVIAALQQILHEADARFERGKIGLVSLSTTLATNALVEGKGAAIAVVLIGFDDVMLVKTELAQAIPSAKIIRVNGGHRYDGSEQAPLDETALVAALDALHGSVEAYAVASVYSVRNPSHEQRAKALIQQLSACPVTASYELSDALNGPRRALTAAFNARIIGLIVGLVTAVQSVMTAENLSVPLMIVKGDGSLARAEVVLGKPIETILSGPAASVLGANFLLGLNDFLLSDIGGTTTDVALVKNGWPALSSKGAMVGQHRTMVQAIEMHTIGLGGDSAVDVDFKGNITLASQRVVPVALLGQHYPEVMTSLRHSLAQGMGLAAATRYVLRPQGASQYPLPSDLSKAELTLLELLGERPQLWTQLAYSISERNRLNRLLDRGLIQVSGVTPSDAAHVLGLQAQWSTEAAQLACLMLGRSHGKISYNEALQVSECHRFAEQIFQAVIAKTTHILLECLTGQDFPAQDPWLQALCQGKPALGLLQLAFKPAVPLVAVGGPAAVFYPTVGQRLAAEVLIPAHSQVANAIGAAVGLLRAQASVSITSIEGGGYTLHSHTEPMRVVTAPEALQQAEQLARALAEQQISAQAGTVLHTEVRVERVDIPDMLGDLGLISATLYVECLGKSG